MCLIEETLYYMTIFHHQYHPHHNIYEINDLLHPRREYSNSTKKEGGGEEVGYKCILFQATEREKDGRDVTKKM